jgi:hypothetical protein
MEYAGEGDLLNSLDKKKIPMTIFLHRGKQ